VLEILQILYGTDAGEVDWVDEMGMGVQPFREMGQSHLRIIELVQSLCFDWFDSLTSDDDGSGRQAQHGDGLCSGELHDRESQTASGAYGRDRLRGVASTAGHDAHEMIPPTAARPTGKCVVRPAARVTWDRALRRSTRDGRLAFRSHSIYDHELQDPFYGHE
jgi:hypothetical protein